MKLRLGALVLVSCTPWACVPEQSAERGLAPLEDPTTCGEVPPPSPEPTAEWTLLVYAATDDRNRNVVAGFDADAEEWARLVGGSKMFRVVVQRDYSKVNTGSPPAERYVLERGQKLHPETLEPGSLVLSEPDTTRPEPLRDFLETSIRRFPARKYWLVVTGHGDSWMGLLPDASDLLGRSLSIDDLRGVLASAGTGALAEVRATVPGSPRLDVVQFDACRMGSVEVASALSGVADTLIASQEAEPAEGHPYGAFYNLAQLHLGVAPRTAAAEVVADYVRSYNASLSTRSGAYVGTAITAVALDLGSFDALLDALAHVVAAVRAVRPAGLPVAEVDAIRAALPRSGGAAGAGQGALVRSVAEAAAVDLGGLLKALATTDTLGPEVSAAALQALSIVGRPDDRHDPNRRFGFVRLVGFPVGSPFVTEAHSLPAGDCAAPTGLSIMFAPLARISTPALDVYRSQPFDARVGGWSSLFASDTSSDGLQQP